MRRLQSASMWERFPPRMRKAITAALEEAGRAGAEQATAEHLLAAIAKDPACAANFMLEHAGVAPAAVLERLKIADGDPHARAPERAGRFSSAALHVLDVSADPRAARKSLPNFSAGVGLPKKYP